MRESNTRISLTYKYLITGQPSYLRSLLSFPSHRRTRFSSLITLSRPSLTFCHKIANRSYYHSAPVLWNYLPSDLRHVAHHHVIPSPILNLPVSDLSTYPFLQKVKNLTLSLFLSSIVCIHLCYLRTDISGIDQASLFFSHTHFAIIYRPFIHANFILFDLLNMFNFFRLYKSPPFHTVIRIHYSTHLVILSYFSFLPSQFSSMEQMLMLNVLGLRLHVHRYAGCSPSFYSNSISSLYHSISSRD